jgi:hypothetical protein
LLVNWLRVRQVGGGGNAYQAKRHGRNDQKFKHIQPLNVRNGQLMPILYQSAINRPTFFDQR